jgi:hypothetical protein
MPRTLPALLLLALLLALSPAALALVTQHSREEVGPAKGATAAKGAGPEAAFRLSPLRCYWRESGWHGWGATRDQAVAAFRGSVDEATAALATFAALPAPEKEVRVFPAPGYVRSADGKVAHASDWEVRWAHHTQSPYGKLAKERSESHTAVMTLFVSRAGRIPEADPRAGRWVKELDDDSYPARERAFRALADMGEAALPALREGLGRPPSPEQRRRIVRLLDRLRPIHLSRVKFPKGVRVVSLDRLVEAEVRNWRSGDTGRSWQAATLLAEWAEYSEDAHPLLAEALRDQRDHVRTLAAGAFARLGRRAEGVLPRLRTAADDVRDPGPRDALKKAIQAVAEGADVPGVRDTWRENRRLRGAIDQHCRTAPK